MAIIRPEPNKPLTLSLKYASAQEKQGKYGKQFLYTVEPNDVIYLPPIAHDEIQKLHAGPGEPFTLTKSIGQGNQAQWKVERITPSAPLKAETERPVSQIGVTLTPKSSTNGKAPIAVMPAAAPTLSTPQSKAMLRQLIAAIDAGIAATAYAKSQNFPLELTSRDICAIAISGSIQQFREGVY